MSASLKYILILLISALLFLPFLGNVHLFDWDEINFAECAREMLATGDYLRPQIDYQPFWEKPPLFIWMQALSMNVFGVGEYAARFPNALIGIITLLTLFYIGKRIVNEKMALWWTLLYAACWLPHFYFKSGIIDPTFNFFIFLAFLQLHLLRFSSKKTLHAALAGLFLGLAVLTKGPAAILIALLCFAVYLVVNKGLWGYKIPHLFIIALVAAATFFLWIAAAILVHGWDYGTWFLDSFVKYQIKLFSTEDAGHGGPFFYHFIVLLLGCFPASIFLFQYTRSRTTDNEPARDFTKWMWILFSVVLILFSIVKTKIVHYSSMCYFPLTYLAALKIYQLQSTGLKLKSWIRLLFLIVGIIFAVIFIALPVVGVNIKEIATHVNDPVAVADMQAAVSWHWSEALWGLLYFVAIVFAFILINKNLPKALLVLCVAQIVIAQVLILHFTPKIEAYSQRPGIEYYKSFVGQDVYVYPLGFHSYAHLFYTKKAPTVNTKPVDRYSLPGLALDKPTFYVCRVNKATEFRSNPDLIEIGSKNSFIFFRRK